MNETIHVLKTRRSVRKYTTEPVREADIAAILEAGLFAPTGRDSQNPIMVVVQDLETIADLSRLNADVLGTKGDPFYGAPLLIVVFADPARNTWVEDGSLVLGNLMNAAAALGLGSAWINRAKEVFDSDAGKAYMHRWGVPAGLRGVGNCIVGYADGPWPAAHPRKAGRIIRT